MATEISSKSSLSVFLAILSGFWICGITQAGLKGACAKVDITPPLGITLIGSQGKPSDAVRDNLYAKAMILSDGANTVAILSADLLYTPIEEITGPVRAGITERLGIPAQNIMVCATHTHSGPEVFTRSKLPQEGRLDASQIDRAYLQVLVRKMADAVVMAGRNMQDVRIGAATGSLPEVLYNRRPKAADGRAKMMFTLPLAVIATREFEPLAEGGVRVAFAFPPGQEQLQFGPIDPTVFALRMENAEGKLVGSLIGFGCHPVCIYPDLKTTISADYPAFATRIVEQAEGGISLFALGLAGNAVPIQRGTKPCEQIGKALGSEALKRLQLAPTAGDVTLKVASREITLPVRATPSGPESITSEIQLLKLGGTWILGLPGEVLVEVGLAIKKKSGIESLFIVTLANDTVGYVCHSEAYEQAGYEPTLGTYLAKGAGEIMIEQALALINEMK